MRSLAATVWRHFMATWLRHPVEGTSFWIALSWAGSLLSNPEPPSAVHALMADIMPLWGWGASALAVAALHFTTLHLRGWLVACRWHALLMAGFLWGVVAIVFWSSGVSITGKGVYTVLAWACFFKAWQADD